MRFLPAAGDTGTLGAAAAGKYAFAASARRRVRSSRAGEYFHGHLDGTTSTSRARPAVWATWAGAAAGKRRGRLHVGLHSGTDAFTACRTRVGGHRGGRTEFGDIDPYDDVNKLMLVEFGGLCQRLVPLPFRCRAGTIAKRPASR